MSFTSGTARLRGGVELAWEASGDPSAPPLLFVPPLGGSMPLFEPIRSRLAASFRVIAFDPRGRGRSSARAPLPTTRGMARDAARLLGALDVDRAHVVGVSLGGMVASWMAVDAPSRVRGLVLASTPARGLDLLRPSRLSVPLALCLTRRARDVEPCLVRALLGRALAGTPEREAIDAAVLRAPRGRGALLVLALAALRHDARDAVTRIRGRTLVVAGERDALVPLALQRGLCARIPGARLAIVAGAGHALAVETPLDLAALVTDFLAHAA